LKVKLKDQAEKIFYFCVEGNGHLKSAMKETFKEAYNDARAISAENVGKSFYVSQALVCVSTDADVLKNPKDDDPEYNLNLMG